MPWLLSRPVSYRQITKTGPDIKAIHQDGKEPKETKDKETQTKKKNRLSRHEPGIYTELATWQKPTLHSWLEIQSQSLSGSRHLNLDLNRNFNLTSTTTATTAHPRSVLPPQTTASPSLRCPTRLWLGICHLSVLSAVVHYCISRMSLPRRAGAGATATAPPAPPTPTARQISSTTTIRPRLPLATVVGRL